MVDKLLSFLQVINTDLSSLKKDRITALEIATTINKNLGSNIDASQLLKVQSLPGLLKKAQTTIRLSETGILNRVHTFSKKINKDPITNFILPGLPGNALAYGDLARTLSKTGATYGIHMQGTMDDVVTENSLEQMAHYNLQGIQSVGGVKDIRIFAHSFGGIVAYEMIRQASKYNVNIKELILMDSYANAFSVGEGSQLRLFINILLDLTEIEIDAIELLIEETMRIPTANSKASHLYRKLKSVGLGVSKEFFHRIYSIATGALSIKYQYTDVLDIPVVLVKSKESLNPLTTENMGWEKCYANMNIIEGNGDHLTITQSPNCSKWLSKLGSVRECDFIQ
jgi:thioesterase domain-containing protein